MRQQSLGPYNVLGVSPTCEPELIDAAYRTLIRKYGGNDGEREHVQAIKAAYDQLKDSQRDLERAATGTAADAPIVGTEMWQVRPRTRPLEPAFSRPADSEPPPEPSFSSHAPAAGIDSQANVPSARHWTISDWSNEKAPSQSEPPPFVEPMENPVPDEAFVLSRNAAPLVGGLAVLGAALLTQFLSDRSPALRPPDVQREAAAPSQRPIASLQSRASVQRRDRIVAAVRVDGAKQLTPSAAEPDDIALVNDNRGQVASTRQPSILPTEAASLAVKRPSAAIAPSADPVPESSVAALAIPASPTPADTSRPAMERPQQIEQPRPLMAAPARWISGGLQDTDNRKGRFEGAVAVRITVRPDGRAGSCRVAQSSGDPRLDQTTCQILGPRLRFSPARDAAGRAIESEVGTTYVWGRRIRRK